MKSARCRGILAVLNVLLALVAGLWLTAVPQQSAEARHELELAQGLANDFEMFELAKEILRGKNGTPDNPGGEMKKALDQGDPGKAYKEQVAIALCGILQRQKMHQPEKADELNAEYQKWIKFAGAGLSFWAARLEEANTLTYETDRENDPDKKADLKSKAIAAFTECAAGYRTIRDGIFPEYNDGDLKEGNPRLEDLKLGWYYWCQCLYELAKLGDNRTENIDTITVQLDEMMFEWGDQFIGYYCMLLKGDAWVLNRQWGKAESEYTGVLGLPVKIDGISPDGQKALDSLRMQAYHKLALAYLGQGNHERLVNKINQMFAEYPSNRTARELKLCRLLRAESQVHLLLGEGSSGAAGLSKIRKVIDDLSAFATDPEAFFRFKYYEMLSNIGRAPGLDLELRLRCGRAAYDSFKFKEAAEIYQLVLTSLRVVENGRLDKVASKKNFERYAPEAYWRLGEAFSQQWRFFEAGYVYYRAAKQFNYFATTYKEVDKLPDHMMDGDSAIFDEFDDAAKLAAFPLELAKKAKLCIAQWSPGGRDPASSAASPRPMKHSVEESWVAKVNQLERDIESQVGDQSKVERDMFSDIWKLYSTEFEKEKAKQDYDYNQAIGGFATVRPIIGYDLYYQSFQFCADLMRRMYDQLDGRTPSDVRNKIRDPFPEPVRDDMADNLYAYEQQRMEARELFPRLPDNHREMLIALLEKIQDQTGDGWKVADNGQPDYRLLYWYKARYFIMRLFYLVMDRRYDDINNADPKAWNRSMGQVLGVWCTIANQEAGALDQAGADKARGRIRDVAMAVWQYGVLVRTSPWSQPPAGSGNNPANIGWLWIENDDRCKRLDDDFKAECLDLWRDYSSNFGPAFTHHEAKRKGELQLQFKSLERGLLYLSFYLHIRKSNPVAAETVMQAFNLAFPAGEDSGLAADMVAQNKDWRLQFTKTLAQKFEQVNWDENNIFAQANKNIVPNIAKLRASDKITIKDLERSISEYVIYCWIESATGNNVVCKDEESLMYAFLARYVRDARGVTFIKEQGGVDRDALNEWLDRPENAEIADELFRDVDGMNRYRESHSDFFETLKSSDRDLVHLDRDDLLEMLKGHDGTPPEIEMLDLDKFAVTAQKRMTDMAKADDTDGMIAEARKFSVDLRPANLPTTGDMDSAILEDNKRRNADSKDYPPVLRLAHVLRITALPKDVQSRMVELAKANDDAGLIALCKQNGVTLEVPGKADSKLRVDLVKGRLAAGDILVGQKYADEIGQMYGGYQSRVFLDRYKVADSLEAVFMKYQQSIIRLDRKALSYYSRYWAWEMEAKPELWTPKEKYDQGMRFFGAELWDQAIEYMEPILDQVVAQKDRNGNPIVKVDKVFPFGIMQNNRAHKTELPLRYYVGRAYYEKAIISGEYDPNDANWKKVDEHFERVYQFVQFRNIERQKGNQAPIVFEDILDEWYYVFLERLAKYYELRAKYFTQKKNAKEAESAWVWAISVHYLIFKQSPKYSPDERMAKFEQCRIYLKIAMLGTEDRFNEYIKRGLQVFNGEYRGRDYKDPDLMLGNDPEYDRAMDALYPEFMKLGRERKLIK